MKNIEQTKEKILEELKGLKGFEVSYATEIFYSKTFKAKNKEELEEKFNMGELKFDNSDICREDIMDNSLEISESEE